MNSISRAGISRQRWMLVDDDRQVLKLMQLSLSRFHDVEIRCCNDTTEALNVFAAVPNSFQGVITDFNVAPSNCLAMCARMRSLAPDLKIVLITGDLNAISDAQARALGFAATLFKPFSVAALRTTVTAVMRDRLSPREVLG